MTLADEKQFKSGEGHLRPDAGTTGTKLGVSRQTIHAIEANKYIPSTLLAMKLARLFEKAVGEIFRLEEID